MALMLSWSPDLHVLKGSRHKPQNIFTKVNLKQMALEARQHNLLIEHLNIVVDIWPLEL